MQWMGYYRKKEKGAGMFGGKQSARQQHEATYRKWKRKCKKKAK
jgi:hypothetical protein